MTQVENDLYGIKNDGRGWRRVSEAAFCKFIKESNSDPLETADGYGHFRGHFGGQSVEGVLVKCLAEQLPRISDAPLKSFIQAHLEMRSEADESPQLHYLKKGSGEWQSYCQEHYREVVSTLFKDAEPAAATQQFLHGDTAGVMGTATQLRALNIPELTRRLPAGL